MNKNELILELFSSFLTNHKCDITYDDIKEIKDNDISLEMSYALMIFNMYGFDMSNQIHKEFFYEYILKSIKNLDINKYLSNPYLNNIKLENLKLGKWSYKNDVIKAYEGFSCGDLINDGEKIIPQIGFFTSDYKYPAVYENDRLWMSIVPNEIETMEDDINSCSGNVLVLGLGLGYFPYMISLKDDVKSITIVERNKDAIDLFNKYILSQFEFKEKIKVIQSEAFEFLDKMDSYDTLYADLWHDVSDGIDMYLKIKEYEKKYPKTKFMYWIEKSMKCYIK